MKCPRCGAENAPTAWMCAACEWRLATPYPPPRRARHEPDAAPNPPPPEAMGAPAPRRGRPWGVVAVGLLLGYGAWHALSGLPVPAAAPAEPVRAPHRVAAVTGAPRPTARPATSPPAAGPGQVADGRWVVTGTFSPGTPITIPVVLLNGNTGAALSTTAVLDTGAWSTGIAPAVARQLALPRIGAEAIGGVTGVQWSPEYGGLAIATPAGQVLWRVPAVWSTTTLGTFAPMLIGRDLLDTPGVHLTLRGDTFRLSVPITAPAGPWRTLAMTDQGVRVQITVPATWSGWRRLGLLVTRGWYTQAPASPATVLVQWSRAGTYYNRLYWRTDHPHGPPYPGTCEWTAVSGPPQAASVTALCPEPTATALVQFEQVPLSLIDTLWRWVQVSPAR